MSLPRKKLPIGVQNLREIREEGHYYVDKTPYACRLARDGKYYFLSRPRRFGKSLFLDTLKELFEGNRALFTGLHAEDHWDWSRTHPVIRISFGEGMLESREQLREKIIEILRKARETFGVDCVNKSISGMFMELIEGCHKKHGQTVVVLVDEYDKPILDIRVEESSHAGRLDMVVIHGGRCWVFEFKMVEDGAEGTALAQIRERGYDRPHREAGLEVVCVGVEFSKTRRNIVAWDIG